MPNERTNQRGSPVRRRSLQRRQALKKRGAAVAELAVTIPLIALVVMSTIETCSMLFLKQALRIAAYEGARVSLVPGSQTINVEAGCNEILTTRKVKNATITVTPSDFNQQPYGTVVKVKVSADCASNSLFVPWVFTGRTISSELSMMIER
ncbi:MAG: TadE family protein [Pirellulales bacterium]